MMIKKLLFVKLINILNIENQKKWIKILKPGIQVFVCKKVQYSYNSSCTMNTSR